MKRYINLLPPEQQKNIRLARVNSQVLSFVIWLILSILIFATVLFASFLVLRQRLESLQGEIAEQTKTLEELKETSVRKEVEIFSSNLKNFDVLQKSQDGWSRVLEEIARGLPADMTIDTMSINRADRKVELSGRGGSRNSVLQYRKTLIASANFVNLNFPLANLEKSKDLSWKYRFYVKPEFLK